MTREYSRSIGFTAFAGFAFFLNSAAYAQSEPETSAAPQYSDDDIIVTARRVQERIQDVPIAITALSGDALKARSIFDNNDLQYSTPALTTNAASGHTNVELNYTIRGQGLSNTPGAPQGVIPYFADVPTTNTAVPFYDIASVEVLKGPQGTLFGRNTTGGAVLINPAEPNDQAVEGYVLARLGSLHHAELEGAINLPITQGIAVRAAGNIRRRDGYVRNLTTGRLLNDISGEYGRVSLLLEPFSGLRNIAIFDYAHLDQNGSAQILVGVRPNGPAATTFGTIVGNLFFNGTTALGYLAEQQQLGDRKVRFDTPLSERRTQYSVINTTTLDLGAIPIGELTIKNIFGYIRIKNRSGREFDSTPLPIVNSTQAIPVDNRQITEELQLQGTSELLDFVVGGFYYDVRPTQKNLFDRVPTVQILFGIPGNNGTPTTIYGGTRETSKALFAQATLKLDSVVQGLRLTGGIRQTWDKRATESANFSGGIYGPVACTTFPGATLTNCVSAREAKFKATTWALGVDYKINSDVLLYATARKGYKAGFFNGSLAPTDPGFAVAPEYLNDYEAGIKSDWNLGGARLRFNAAGFYGKYQGIQRAIVTVTNGVIGTRVANAASAEIYGLEAETLLRLPVGLSLGANYSLTKSKFLKILNPLVATQSGGVLANMPKHKVSLTAAFEQHLGDNIGTLAASALYYWQSSYVFSDNSAVEPFSHLPAYGIVNGRIDWRNITGTRTSIGVYVKNLFKKKYALGGLALYNDVGIASHTFAEPRTFGVEVNHRF